jgi:hypothetical protein
MRKDLLRKNFIETIENLSPDIIDIHVDMNFISYYVNLLDEQIPEEELTFQFFYDLGNQLNDLSSDLMFADKKETYYQIIKRTLGWNDLNERNKVIEKIKEITLDSDDYDFEDDGDDYEEFDFEEENDL